VFCLCSRTFAQMGEPTSRSLEFKKLTPDPAQNEVEKNQIFRGDVLLQETTKYSDESLRLKEFNPKTGLLYGEVFQDPKGTLINTIFYEDGKTPRAKQIISRPLIESFQYRKTGDLWFHEKSDQESRKSIYYPLSDHVIHRTISRKGTREMHVTVVDKKTGSVLYQQTWNSGASGAYSLTKVEETTTNGEKRVVHLQGKKIVKVDYLTTDGSVARTVSGDSMIEPVDESRLDEFNYEDDPSVPRRRLPRGVSTGPDPLIDPKPDRP
ncbi:MAG TPA: hypothetical protein PKD05_22660, partial [Candidatus Melainabacteria bacterium]|nr:hypothetical protein [Candidatus Melainabacteria bacterium]